MKKKTTILTTTCLILSVSVVLVLYLASNKINHSPGSFIRLMPPHPVEKSRTFDIKYNSYYFAGITKENLYLGNMRAPLHVLKIDLGLTDSQHLKINLRDLKTPISGSSLVKIDSPYFFIMDRMTRQILRGSMTDFTAEKLLTDTINFSEVIPMSDKSFAVRALSGESPQNILAKAFIEPYRVEEAFGILEKQVDGLFCTDGMLHFEKNLHRLVYVYFYRNQFICMDTNFNVTYRGNTIDTISKAQIKTTRINSSNTFTMSGPPLTVNKKSCVWEKWLFVNSGLLAKNERKEDFQLSSVVDVYDLDEQVYKFSFYLQNPDRKKLSSMKVYNNKLLAIHENILVCYQLVPKYFPQ